MFVQFLYFSSLVSLKSALKIQFNFLLVFKKKINPPITLPGITVVNILICSLSVFFLYI